MELIKKINNNYAVARDSSGQIVIVAGSGLGFGKFPYELTDLTKVERTYYNIDNKFINLISEIPDAIIKCSTKIVDYAQANLSIKLNPNLVFTLADHINFATKRIKEGLSIDYGITYEMNYLHPEEFHISKEAVKLIKKMTGVTFPKEETAIIAMHILEAEHFKEQEQKSVRISQIIDDLADIIRKKMNVVIDEDDFNYFRFATHVQYLISRQHEKMEISSDNKALFESMKSSYPDVYECVLQIEAYFKENQNWTISDEEKMYLIIHINRICSKEDCYQ